MPRVWTPADPHASRPAKLKMKSAADLATLPMREAVKVWYHTADGDEPTAAACDVHCVASIRNPHTGEFMIIVLE